MIKVLRDGYAANHEAASNVIYRGACQLCGCDFECDWMNLTHEPYRFDTQVGPILINTVDQCPQCWKGPVVVRFERIKKPENSTTAQNHEPPTA